MKRRISLPVLIGTSVLLSLSACVDDWGQQDPAAGSQITYGEATLGSYDFESDDALAGFTVVEQVSESLAPEVSVASLEEGETDYYGKVLNLNGGAMRIANPFKGATGSVATITFYMKQSLIWEYHYEDDGVTVIDSVCLDYLDSELLTWATSSEKQSLVFTPNGGLKMNSAIEDFTINQAAGNRPTGVFQAPGAWHWVTMEFNKAGYTVYADGYKRINETNEYAGKVLDFLNNADYLTFGSKNTMTSVDQITFATKSLTADVAKDPRVKEAGSEEAGFEYVVGDWIAEIGASDCSAGWWAEFSNYFRIPVNSTLTLNFENHTSGANNWNNWNLAICTDDERGGGSYAEYAVVRSDLYGWGDSYATGTWESEGYGDWDAFRADMEGADVVITISRVNANVTIDAVATCKNGNVYHEKITFVCGDGKQVIRAFLIVDGSHLKMNQAGCSIEIPQEFETAEVGTSDCLTGWWSAFSDYFSIDPNATLTLNFENHTSGANNWNNWNLALCTDDERGGGSYAEYAVVRSDLYGWGDSYATGTWESEGYGDWDAFRADMEGADVVITISRVNANVTIDAVATCKNGNVYHEKITFVCGDGKQVIRAFLIVDGSYLKLNASGCKYKFPL